MSDEDDVVAIVFSFSPTSDVTPPPPPDPPHGVEGVEEAEGRW